MTTDNPVLVLDFGAQYAQLIARRIREAGRYSEVVPGETKAAELLARNPSALVLSGGPASVYAPGAPQLDPGILELDLPMLGICYGSQVLAAGLGGTVSHTAEREFGATDLQVLDPGSILVDQPSEQSVWMSHGDAITAVPAGYSVLASSAGAPVAVFAADTRPIVGVQYHPEVAHTPFGQDLIVNFLAEVAQLEPDWDTSSIIEQKVAAIRDQVGDGYAICGLSGGVDSAVAAALVQAAIGDRLTCVLVDHGLLREGERAQVERDFVAATGVDLVVVDARDRFLSALADVSDPEQKRKIIGREFIRVFEEAEAEIARGHQEQGFLVQGTLYPDVVESGGGSGAATIKSHHNVGGLPDDLEFELVEPLRDLFKDEVRAIGLELAVPAHIVQRHPFPGPGLAIRIVGAVSEERLRVLRAADAVVRAELDKSDDPAVVGIWQCPVVLLADVRSVGVQGDSRTYGHPIVLRPVTSEDAMTADWSRLPHELLARISNRITNEVPEVNRVVLDVTSKPPGTIEWE